ncbi:MAG TPA: MBL fold metallo-hydrolase [Pyrinomonadaceae bacterium]|jgi:glyoxylase-like metal-dependent hydrolase (beta-lactamase superfamily II)
MSRLVFALLLCLLAAAPPALAQRRIPQSAPSRSVTKNSYVRARRILDAGLAALGGLDALRATEDVTYTGKGVSYARNQSVRVNPPFDAMSRDESLFVDLRNRRYIFENRDPLPGGFVFGGKTVISGGNGFFVNPIDKTVAPVNLANFNNINFVRRLPHLLLLTALERAATLRWLGEEMYQGRTHNLVAFATANGVLTTLFFDTRTNLLTKYEQMVTDPLDGDALQETIFPDYRTVGGFKVPTARVTKRNGETLEDVKYVDVRFNTRPPESAFAKPEGYEELPLPTPPPTKETKLADGVYLLEGGANTLAVEFEDYVLMVEPYAGGRGPKPTYSKARELFPGKPVKYIVVTHHHDDHSGGLRSYIAEGVTVVTTPANQRYFERMASGTFTINPDDQTTKPRPVVFEFLQNKKRVFTDGKQTVEVIDIGPSPHAEEMLIVYLPKERLVFQGDLVNLPANGKYRPTTVNDSTIHFAETIKRLGLDVKRIAAVHGPMTTLDDLRDAIDKKRAAK